MAIGSMQKKTPATQGYGAIGGEINRNNPAPGKPVFKQMTLSKQGNSVKATHHFVDPQHDNEHYIFGEGEQKGLMNHIGKHLGFTQLTGKKNAPEGPEDANASANPNAKDSDK
jgi:hypothetical protein